MKKKKKNWVSLITHKICMSQQSKYEYSDNATHTVLTQNMFMFFPIVPGFGCATLTTCLDVFILVFTHTPMCVSTVYSESCEKTSQVCYSGRIRTHNPCNSRAVPYQLDYRLPGSSGALILFNILALL